MDLPLVPPLLPVASSALMAEVEPLVRAGAPSAVLLVRAASKEVEERHVLLDAAEKWHSLVDSVEERMRFLLLGTIA